MDTHLSSWIETLRRQGFVTADHRLTAAGRKRASRLAVLAEILFSGTLDHVFRARPASSQLTVESFMGEALPYLERSLPEALEQLGKRRQGFVQRIRQKLGEGFYPFLALSILEAGLAQGRLYQVSFLERRDG